MDLLIAGHHREMVEATLRTHLKQDIRKYLIAEQVFQTLSQASWVLGLTAGVFGLLRTNYLQNQSTLPIYLGGIAVPIVLGLLLSTLFFYPLLRQIRLHRLEWENYLDMGIAGVLLLHERHHALYVETVLKAYFPQKLSSAPVQQKPVKPKVAAPTVFKEALVSQQEEATFQEPEINDAHEEESLSVDQLRRFRPVQRKRNEP